MLLGGHAAAAEPVKWEGVHAQEAAGQYAATAAELERALPAAASNGRVSGGDPGRPLEALPAALSNAHDALLAVAAKLEGLHARVQDAKEAHLALLSGVRMPDLALDVDHSAGASRQQTEELG